MDYREFRLARIAKGTEGVRFFAFEGEVPPYMPGCFFLIRLAGNDGKPVFRPFSAASHPSEAGLQFCVKKNGAFTELLWNLREGDSAQISGPYGTFALDGNDGERVFVAGGVGIAPLRSMIRQTLLEGRRATLFHSARTRSSMAYSEEMAQLAAKNPGFRFFPAITREELPQGWGGMKERLTAEAVLQRLGAPDGKAFYLCGTKEMVSSIAEGLMKAGVPKERVKRESWG
ncbi:MAG: FAD-dependent oxidoreductase [Candidatus Micrarchaeia archaeon]|jgi:propane monooxygenase reductase subunit